MPRPENLSFFESFGYEPPKEKRAPKPPAPAKHRDSREGSVVYTGLAARDLPVHIIEEFRNPLQVRDVLRRHAQGDFSRSAWLVDAMLTDARIAGCLEARINGLQGLTFEMQPAAGQRPNRRRQRAVADEALKMWREGVQLADRVNLLTWGVVLGVGIGQLRWEKTARKWKPYLEVWHGSSYRWSWERRCYQVQTLDQGLVDVTPGDGQWVVYTPYGYEAGWLRALVRRLAVPFCGRLFGQRDLLRNSEVQGNPSRVAKYPRTAEKDEIHSFIRALAALATDSVVSIPLNPGDGMLGVEQVPQYSVELLEAKGRPYEVFRLLLDRMDADIAIAICGQNLTTEVKGGSYAAANIHQSVRTDYIKRDGEQATELFREQVLKPWTIVHYNDSALTPIPWWDTEPPINLKARATTLKELGLAIEALRDKGRLNVKAEALADEFNLELHTTEDGKVKPLPGVMLPEDLKNGTVRRDERRERLGLPPLGGALGEELLGGPAQVVEVPKEALEKDGERAEETLLTLLSLRTSSLRQLSAGAPEAYRREARWFAKRHEVEAWRPAIEAELKRRGLSTRKAAHQE